MENTSIYQQTNDLLNHCQSFVLSTIDGNGFPYVSVVSVPLKRKGISLFHFYINGDGKTAINIAQDERGCVCCYDEKNHQSVALRGKFKLYEVSDLEKIQSELAAYQKELNYSFPLIAKFTAMSISLHHQLKDQQLDLK